MSESAARGLGAMTISPESPEQHQRLCRCSPTWGVGGEFVPLVVSPSGASETCPVCGTVYDRHELVGYVPPVGDGCDNCAATEEDIDALTT